MFNITKQTTMGRIIQSNENNFKVFWKLGIFVAGNPMLKDNTIEDICKMYEVDVYELISLLKAA